MPKSPFEVLGVDTDVTDAELKTAYRKLTIKYHPDVSDEPDAQERFQEIVEAYNLIEDPKQRKNIASKAGVQMHRGVDGAVQQFFSNLFHI